MTASIKPGDWLRLVEREYLETFVRDGGSTVKFAVPLDAASRTGFLDGLASAASRAGYLTIRIQAAETKAHMVHELFFRTAQQVPWAKLARRAIERIATDAGYTWVDKEQGPLYRHLADVNGVEPQMLLMDLKQAIWKKVFKQSSLSKDFRMAMTHLCYAELAGGQDGATTTRILTEWLTGRNKAIGAVKPFQIFCGIHRANARHFYESLTNWVRFAGLPGLAVLLDADRLTVARNPHDNGLFYSKAAVLDAYEVLRQFIDSGGRWSGFFLAVVPGPAFLEDPARGIGAYEALKFRVFDEVRDKHVVNPLASLVRVAAAGAGR
ncbi:MAG: DUF2791 family P-loop domain-containing protein [Bryobacterales bacterium]|nr:DUF2791 family P-loop domain-containing protein [Bryobacterales bacterium]